MMGSERFRIKRPDVIYELLDEELVIVNLRRGSYFSLDRVGAIIWDRIDAQASRDEIVSAIQARCSGEATAMESAVDDLLQRLQSEDLIEPDDRAAAPRPPTPVATERELFAPPVLQKFTDLQELLLLDPIHEVDESGWPRRGD